MSYLNDEDLFSGVAPNFKLLVVSFSVFCDAHSTHLRKKSIVHALLVSLEQVLAGLTHSEGVLEAVRRGLLIALSVLFSLFAEEQGFFMQK